MTGSIHHEDRPVCVRPENIGRYPCHPAITEITTNGVVELLCDGHAAEHLFEHPDEVEKIVMLDEDGTRWPWWVGHEEENGPDVVRARKFCQRAFVDYGCCLPLQIDPDRLNQEV